MKINFFTNMIPHLKRNKIVVVVFSFQYDFIMYDGTKSVTQNASGNFYLNVYRHLMKLAALFKSFVILRHQYRPPPLPWSVTTCTYRPTVRLPMFAASA